MAFRMDEDAFRTGQLAFDDALRPVGDERCQMLDRHVFTAAEAAANIFVFNDDLVLRQAQHVRDFMAHSVGALVRRVDEDAVIKWHGHCAFRFEESVFLPGRFEMVRHLVFRCSNDCIGVAADQVFVAEDVAAIGFMRSRTWRA